MTIQAYQTLYESSIAYGMRKALMAEQGKNEMSSNIKQLEDTCNEHAEEINRLNREIEDTVKRDEEERAVWVEEHRSCTQSMGTILSGY